MTAQENVDVISSQLIEGINASGADHIKIASHCDISPKSLRTFMRRQLKNGGAFNSVASLANYLGYELRLVKRQ